MIFVDSVILIDAIDGTPALQEAARATLAGNPCHASELALSELLVIPIRLGVTLGPYENLLSGLILHPVDRRVLRRAAELRATVPGLKTPDAIHAATATLAGATGFVTRDAGFARVTGLVIVPPGP